MDKVEELAFRLRMLLEDLDEPGKITEDMLRVGHTKTDLEITFHFHDRLEKRDKVLSDVLTIGTTVLRGEPDLTAALLDISTDTLDNRTRRVRYQSASGLAGLAIRTVTYTALCQGDDTDGRIAADNRYTDTLVTIDVKGMDDIAIKSGVDNRDDVGDLLGADDTVITQHAGKVFLMGLGDTASDNDMLALGLEFFY